MCKIRKELWKPRKNIVSHEPYPAPELENRELINAYGTDMEVVKAFEGALALLNEQMKA